MIKVKQQVNKSEQINAQGQIIIDYDQPLKKSSDLLHALKKALGNSVIPIKFNRFKNVFLYQNNGLNHYLIVASITYLSKPHPIFKKRIQLKTWYKDFITAHINQSNTTVNIIGIYHYNQFEIYCDFRISDYFDQKMNSSSAHVYINDLYQGWYNGIFQKQDFNQNQITVIKSTHLKKFFNQEIEFNPILQLFIKFNQQFNFKQWLRADHCIKEMLDHCWYQAKATEWPGWFLEFKIAQFIQQENCEAIMSYTANQKQKGLDFDLYFAKFNFYGDLKSSDLKKKLMPGNDQNNTIAAINQYGRIWYIVYEHETIKDINQNSVMAIARMKLIDLNYQINNHISYQKRMKHSVNFKRMYIFELNHTNIDHIASDFHQGHNSDVKKSARSVKFLLNKENINNSLIFTYKF
ncbi:Methylase-associated X1 domain-containing protein [[Mycoplasma] cavipharyngis]|uniref:hypothetical protein n=1 Tax=[Mycoplasma] cavipharyngis TaxID=92757 RepID=UPI003703E1FB